MSYSYPDLINHRVCEMACGVEIINSNKGKCYIIIINNLK